MESKVGIVLPSASFYTRWSSNRKACKQVWYVSMDMDPYDVTVNALNGALCLKDLERASHCKRVAAFTIAIAKAMGRPDAQTSVLARGAFLHDIGKMAIPDQILRKPDKLMPE